jgi:hypothetical protein
LHNIKQLRNASLPEVSHSQTIARNRNGFTAGLLTSEFTQDIFTLVKYVERRLGTMSGSAWRPNSRPDGNPMARDAIHQAVLFLTHRLDDGVLKRFAGIDVPQNFEKRILLDARAHKGAIPNEVPITTFDLVDLVRRGYQPMWPGCIVPGSNHFPVMEYAASHPEYKYVWVIEYDLIFTGRWSTLFESIPAGPDFVTTQLRSFDDDPSWPWWKIWCCRPQARTFPSPLQFMASFNPIYRLSHEAACFLKARFLEGWCGHHEVAMATLLHCMSFPIEELGGTGKFTPGERHGQFYRNDVTLRRRPIIDLPVSEQTADMLYHPIALAQSARQTVDGFASGSDGRRQQVESRSSVYCAAISAEEV